MLPLEVSYGDGSPIDNETARRIRLALRAETVTFAWRRGDVLVLDNMLTAHGRRPFTGAAVSSLEPAWRGARASRGRSARPDCASARELV